MQKERQPDYPLLYSVQGFLYCDLLLEQAERTAWHFVLNPKSEPRNPKLAESCRSVSQRAAQTLKWEEEENWLLDIALDHLTLGRAALYAFILDSSSIDNRKSAIENLAAGVSGLRRAGTQHWIPAGLLTRAWLRFLTGARIGSESVQEDLDEAWEIAERGSMKLFMADVLLHRARLFRDKAALAEAAKLIEQCGYHRRDEELADAQEAAKNW